MADKEKYMIKIQGNLIEVSEDVYYACFCMERQERKGVLAAWCMEAWNRTVQIMETIGEDGKISALYCLGDLGCNVIARDCYHSTVLDVVTNNLAQVDTPSSKGTGNEVNMEQMLLWNPDVILFAPTVCMNMWKMILCGRI